ncbi:MAG: SOS response-associated peptidase [Clostridia bacterium]|nr:SOS response-associated peptidase [Clostridia bacterium]
MCGRYTIFTEADEAAMYKLLKAAREKYDNLDFKTGEIFPCDRVPVITAPAKSGVDILKWGFPLGDKPSSVIINARAESIEHKPMFSDAFRYRRCVIPSTGFYEWTRDRNKTKFYFRCEESIMLYMAGVWCEDHDSGHFAVITTQANASMSEVHHRMPLILSRNDLIPWMTDETFARIFLHREPPPLVKKAV